MILFPEGRPTKHETFEEYCSSGGYDAIRKDIPPATVLEQVTSSGLRGRGGAGFPVGRKWMIAASTVSETRYVVCNAGEDEPGSFKDRVLMEYRPHLVLEGTLLAAHAIGASQTYLYINETYDTSIARMSIAVEEAQQAGLLRSVAVSVQRAPTEYVAGEDSAALEVLEGRPPRPRPKPPFPAAAGLFGKPTVVNNVETLANVPQIARNGAVWFRGYGTSQSPGTMIFCLGDEVERPGAYELAMGSRIRELYQNLGGGLKNGARLKAVLTGPSSAFLTPDQLDLALDPESLLQGGSSLGCGVMRFYPEAACMVAETARLASFFSRECCGQCPACRMETSMLAAMLERIERGAADAKLFDQFGKVLDFNRGKGYCALINMPGPPIQSALRLFRSEFEHHARYGKCEQIPLG